MDLDGARIGYRFAGAFSVDDSEVPSRDRAMQEFARNPSIAVLPFNNMSSDPEQDHFVKDCPRI